MQQMQRLSRIEDEEHISAELAEEAKRRSRMESYAPQPFQFDLRDGNRALEPPRRTHNPYFSPVGTPGGASTPNLQSYPFLQEPHTPIRTEPPSGTQTPLSMEKVMDEKSDKKPQDLMPFFTDPTGLYFKTFERKLETLNGKNSESTMCIEEYLVKSEKQWFSRLHAAKMNRSGVNTPAVSIHSGEDTGAGEGMEQFLLPQNYEAPSGLKRLMVKKIGDWPVYAFLLALGQIIAANSYQITLLTGQIGETATELYVIASIYFIASLFWWFTFRRLPCFYVLTAPFALYGFAFFLLGMAPYAKTTNGRGWVQYVATGFYAFASASGSFFFSQNFGSTGSAPVKAWGFRACMIQGTQQIYIVCLWWWGSRLTNAATEGKGASTLITYGWPITAITVPIALLLWAVGAVLFVGLPEYYRQAPGAVPSFYRAVFRRKIIVWFMVATFIQNLFLSAPYGRNWKYLWSSKHAPAWSIVLLIILFFIVIWAVILWYFSEQSTIHSWILPMFAVGLGAPRWCQILWSCSNIGMYLPWAGGPVASAILGRMLWLWLGVLDSLQGIGFGMILLQTLTRYHVTFTLSKFWSLNVLHITLY